MLSPSSRAVRPLPLTVHFRSSSLRIRAIPWRPDAQRAVTIARLARRENPRPGRACLGRPIRDTGARIRGTGTWAQ